ncbi:hypothetical protein AAFF_G00074230 [Aldrovandia affinis]|uniref:Uncharacterized protein n=1 Tax=Aldrovandia affinis TaxID=143900 RepID=A0AAD7RYA1_9TELE|nr:hypothetical protein AAFF_G00074230 [Aldrovandia affinis]
MGMDAVWSLTSLRDRWALCEVRCIDTSISSASSCHAPKWRRGNRLAGKDTGRFMGCLTLQYLGSLSVPGGCREGGQAYCRVTRGPPVGTVSRKLTPSHHSAGA